MNDILTEVQQLIETKLVTPFAVGAVRVGLFSQSINDLNNTQYPAVWIEPLDEEMTISDWSNNLTKEYSIRVYIIMQLRVAYTGQIQGQSTFQGKTLNEYTNEIIRILGTNKTLTGRVRLQGIKFKIENFNDSTGREVKSIRFKYIDDLIPYDSPTIDQNNMEKQI